MTKKSVTRRDFIGKTAAGIVGVTVSSSVSSMNAASYRRIIGANDRINIGFLGCGARSMGHQNMIKTSEKEKNLAVIAVCDIWKLNKEKAAANCKKLFGTDVKQFKYSEEMLKMPELDAVMIATGDFQHAKILAEVVNAGKDCYCEKPMAIDVEEAKLARSVVLGWVPIFIGTMFSVPGWYGCGSREYEKQFNKPLKINDLQGLFSWLMRGLTVLT